MGTNWFILLVFATVLQLEASNFELNITPRRAHILVNTRLKIMCQANVPLTDCQFKRTFSTDIYDLSQGPSTPTTKDYDYYGVGLEHGQCGMDLREYIKDHTYDLVGCRVKAEDGVWKYAYMSLVVNSDLSPIYNMEPRQSVVLPGSNFSVLCRAGEELSTCQMKWASQSWTALSKTTTGNGFKYYGAGAEKGQCGVMFTNVTDRINGDVFCAGWTKAKPKGYESDTMVVIVAKPPDAPVLTLDKTLYDVGDVMRASCVVNNSRPVANVTWFLDDIALRSDALDETTDDAKWRWSYDLQVITQHLTRNLTWMDDGEVLACRAEHLALTGGPLVVTETIHVQYKPQNKSVAKQLVSVGEAVTVSMQVFANPQPNFTWQVGTFMIGEDAAEDSGRITTTMGERTFNNAWEVNLTIISLNWTDLVDEGVVLNAENNVGECSYTIPFEFTSTANGFDVDVDNTSDGVPIPGEVAGSGAAKHEAAQQANDGNVKHGFIIGIVVVVIVLTVAAMTVAYARIRKKWCFKLNFGGAQFKNSICDEEETNDSSGNVYLNIRQP